MVSVFASSAVDRGFEPRSGQTKDYKIGICCFSARYAALRKQIVQPIKKPVRTLSIFTSMAFVKDANEISFKNRLKGHIHWRKVRNFIII